VSRRVLVLVFLLGACTSTSADDGLGVGREVYGRVCSACHGATGAGGVGPDLGQVTATFPSCADHVRWITLGSERWKSEVGPTYGADGKDVKGQMPAFESILTATEIEHVAAFERSRYSGQEASAALAACVGP
jgi:mono/diheme cytochrome c family protein